METVRVKDFMVAVDEQQEFDDADSSLGEDAVSSTASLNSSILAYRNENGRTYHAFKEGRYHFPNDEQENERLDLQHHIFYLTFDGKLGLAPPIEEKEKPLRVLDLGTGTGIWAMDYADENPKAEVIGVDLSATQPQFVPPNVFFQIDDFEEDWTYSQKFDYIHSRMNNSSVVDWKRYIKQAYDNLVPGGYLELQEFNLPLSDDNTLTPDTALYKAMDLLGQAATIANHAFIDLGELRKILIETGFEDVVEIKYKWPSNMWPKDKKHKEIGLWNGENVGSGLEGFLMAALTRALGWTKEEVDVLAAKARADVKDRSIHAYWPVVVVYGRKPEKA
ncbi:methyltransferase domain-containing protein [Podospora fimiseda]|uniref:Methyltransferase domain-containing protein n=1 Tax=Podospora fimiseda TaxID=252190 RepID=A0AAN6YNX4_9PEZI|nr:methyltransferase domain-containing protein [Podospora fimiseda]